MKVQFWGTRGSIARAGPETVRFGGNTSCVEARSAAGTLVVLDCGTGAHLLGQSLVSKEPQPLRGHILISHTHWDHIQGIPFFAPLFVPGNEWDIYAPRGLGPSLREALAGQMQYTYFPVTLEGFGATIRFHELMEGTFRVGDITVHTRYMNHPALTLGYRLEADGVSVVYACDHEPNSRQYAEGTGAIGDQDRRHVEFLKEADLAIHDAQYTASEYSNKIGWGHTPVNCAVEMCLAADVRQLALTHHDPMRDDDSLEKVTADARARAQESDRKLNVFAASEGMSIELTAPVGPKTPQAQVESTAVAPPALALREQTVLIGVGDEANARNISQAALDDGLETLAESGTENLLSTLRAARPSLVILDDRGAGGDVLATTRAIRRIGEEYAQDVPVIVVADVESHDEGAEAGVTDWLLKPFTEQYARTRIRAWVMRTACKWMPAPLPENEAQRLTALDEAGLLDTEPEDRFDRITRIAAAALDAPVALVSLIDRDRQFFKSTCGIDVRESPRDTAFCAHAILHDDVMVVPDALIDPRFADNPLVTDPPRVRFYAGCPLRLPDGSCIGTLCVIDVRPRELDDNKIELLRELAKFVEREIASTPD